jgi:hypothetical protein
MHLKSSYNRKIIVFHYIFMEIYKRSLFLKRNLTLQSSYIDLNDEKHENTIFKS